MIWNCQPSGRRIVKNGPSITAGSRAVGTRGLVEQREDGKFDRVAGPAADDAGVRRAGRLGGDVGSAADSDVRERREQRQLERRHVAVPEMRSDSGRPVIGGRDVDDDVTCGLAGGGMPLDPQPQ